MPEKSESSRGRSKHKYRTRARSPKRRKSGSHRKSSATNNGSLPEPATSSDHPGAQFDSLFQRELVSTKGKQSVSTPDSSALVSPESYKQYARNVLSVQNNTTRTLKDTLSNSIKLDIDDVDSACSVTSYTRNRIDSICQDGDHLDQGEDASDSSDKSDGIQAFIIPTTEHTSESYPEDKSIIIIEQLENSAETEDSVVASEEASCPDVDCSTVDRVHADGAVSDRLSTDDSDICTESRQKTMQWLSSNNQDSVQSNNWWETETLEERYAKEKENFKQTKRILLHVPQVPRDVTSQRRDHTHKTPDANNLSVVLTNSVHRETKSSTKPLDNNTPSQSSVNHTKESRTETCPQNGGSVSHDQRSVFARAHPVAAQQRHAELQLQTEQLLRRKQEIMKQYRLQRWIPIIPDSIDIDDLIIVNTIRKEMHQSYGTYSDQEKWSSRSDDEHSLGGYALPSPNSDNDCYDDNQQSSSQNGASKTDNGFKAVHMATNYDVDTEHQYIMDRALRSYREHRARESPLSEVIQAPVVPNSSESMPLPQPVVQSQRKQRSQSARMYRPSQHISTPSLSTHDSPNNHPIHPHSPASLATSTSNMTRSATPVSPPPAPTLHTNTIDINVQPSHMTQWTGRPSTAQARLGVRHHRYGSQSSLGSNTGSSSLRASPHPASHLRASSHGNIHGPVRIPSTQPRSAKEVQQASICDVDRAPGRILTRAQVLLSMDRTRTNKGNDPKRSGKDHGQGHRQVEGSFFVNTRPKKPYFSIHPDWVSENFSVQSISINQRMSGINGPSGMNAATAAATYPAERRCKSAPPRTRNPITWENPDINELRLRDISLRAGRGRTAKRPKSEVMDSIGTKDVEKQKGAKFNIKSPFFAATNSPRRPYYTIHPEWQSECGQVRKLNYTERSMTFPSRRCKSAPPPRTRNPITWTNADRPDRR